MTKQPRGLEKLFSDVQLKPDKRFVRDLSKQLGAPGEPKQHARRLGRRLATAGGVLLLSLVLIGVTTLRPAPKQLSRTVLLKQLYATAMADELPAPAQSTVTFWDVTQTASGGPAAQACNATIEPYTEHTILFKQGDTTALLTKITSNNIVGMSYSEDPDTPAFDPNVLSVAQNGQLSGLLQGAKLTDVNG
ncbi:MAG TPA: hypothetical protein VLE99_05240, partial [Candidatus Saccharimonadales bacterium]|nr:hypothetical protein [Candidatus Saccharimonadales bacterium]